MLGNILGWSLKAGLVGVVVFLLVTWATSGLPCKEFAEYEGLRGGCVSHGTWSGVDADNAPMTYGSVAGLIALGVVIFNAHQRGE